MANKAKTQTTLVVKSSTSKGIAALALAASFASASYAVGQFPSLAPAYTQQIYTGPLQGGPGLAWTAGGNMLNRNGSSINEFSLSPSIVHNGTNVHSFVTHNITGLNSSGYGMATGLDGYVYTTTGAGLQRFNPSNWAAAAQSLAGTIGGAGYGITTMFDGRIAYCAGGTTSDIYIYDPFANTNTHIYSAPTDIDGITSDQNGNLALAGHGNKSIIIIKNNGTVLNNFFTPHWADGMAFGDGIATGLLYSNNNDGTISRYRFSGPNYSGAVATTDIATGSQAYGDLAAVGPDCAFYVSQFNNFGLNGSTAGIGTHWDNGVTDADPSITRIALKDGTCGFYSPYDHDQVTPEPASLGAMGIGFVTLLRRKFKKA